MFYTILAAVVVTGLVLAVGFCFGRIFERLRHRRTLKTIRTLRIFCSAEDGIVKMASIGLEGNIGIIIEDESTAACTSREFLEKFVRRKEIK